MNAKQKELLEAARAALAHLKPSGARVRLRLAIAAVDADVPDEPKEPPYEEFDIDGGQS